MAIRRRAVPRRLAKLSRCTTATRSGAFSCLPSSQRATGRWLNYLGDEQAHDAIQAAYGPNYRRLRDIKRRYDPDNVFHLTRYRAITGSRTRPRGKSSPGTWCRTSASGSSVMTLAAQAAWNCATSSLSLSG